MSRKPPAPATAVADQALAALNHFIMKQFGDLLNGMRIARVNSIMLDEDHYVELCPPEVRRRIYDECLRVAAVFADRPAAEQAA